MFEFITTPYKPRVKIVRRDGATIGKVKDSYELAGWSAYLPDSETALLDPATGWAKTFSSKEDAAWALVAATPTAYDRAIAAEHAR